MKIPYDIPIALGKEFIELSSEVTAAILLTLIAGWKHATSFGDANKNTGEVAITERLREGMRRELKSGRLRWGKTLLVLPGTESRSSTDVLLPDGRTDIPLIWIDIFRRLGEHDPHAIIECKRIAGSDTHLCREYVVEGIDRFRKGKYGENHTVGFMVGYLLAGSAAEAATGVNAYLTRKARKTEHLQLTDVAAKALSWESQHLRAASPLSIRLHHVFLRFDVVDVTSQ